MHVKGSLWSSICHESCGTESMKRKGRKGNRFIMVQPRSVCQTVFVKIQTIPLLADTLPPRPDEYSSIHRVSYLWSSFITNSVGSSTAISHTLPYRKRDSRRLSRIGKVKCTRGEGEGWISPLVGARVLRAYDPQRKQRKGEGEKEREKYTHTQS